MANVNPHPMDHHCGYCLRNMGLLSEASAGDVPLCHNDDGQDCYRLVTVYGKPIADGRVWGTNGWVPEKVWPR